VRYRRWLWLGVVLALVAGAGALGGAQWARSQGNFPEGAFVVGADDTRWVVGGGARYRISFITDDAGLLPSLREGGVVSTVADAQAALASGPVATGVVAPAPTTRAPATPADSLIGQRATLCAYGVETEVVVARVEWTKTLVGETAPGNAMWIVAFIDVTNQGTMNGGLYDSLLVRDARGREFPWRSYPPNPIDFARMYGVKGAYENFAPGITERTVASFQVPDNVGPLTLEGKRNLCL
jgi:hypothetical protein